MKRLAYLHYATIIAVLNVVLVFFIFGFKEYGDTPRYLNVINWFQGERGVEIEPVGLMRPIGPLLALPFEFIGSGAGLIIQNIIFYILSAAIMFKIVSSIFGNERQAFFGAIFFMTSAQVLETGFGYLTDMGGWFFYLLSLFLTLKFLKNNDKRLPFINGFVSGLGFSLKENGGLGALFYSIIILLRKQLSIQKKVLHIFSFGLCFVIPVGIIQLFSYYHSGYTYLDWFLHGSISSDKEGVILIGLRYLTQLFKILGILWLFILVGLWREVRTRHAERLLIYFALLPSSLSFLGWTTSAGGRSVFIFTPLAILFATVGWMFVEGRFLRQHARAYATFVLPALLMAVNYSLAAVNSKVSFVDKIVSLFGL